MSLPALEYGVRADDPRLQAIDYEMAQKAWEQIRQDTAGFIANFCYIEEGDGGPPIRFALWPEQRRALREIEEHRWVILLKSRQVGLSWLTQALTAKELLTVPGYRAIAVSRTEKEAQEFVRRCAFIFRYLPSWMCRPGSAGKPHITWECTTERLTVHHPGAEDSTLTVLASSPHAGKSFTCALLVLDEWAAQDYAKEIWESAFPTINRPHGGRVIGVSTGERGTFFEDMWNKAILGENGFHAIFLSWKADPTRTKEWYKRTEQALGKASCRKNYPSTPEEAFMVGEGIAFEEWDEDIHIPFEADWYPPEGAKIVRAYDSGYATRAACIWFAILNDGNAVAYREYYPTKVTDEDQAATIVRMSRRPDGTSEDIAYTVADPACWQRKSGTGISTAEVFAKHGVPLRKADNDRVLGWRRVHEWLKPYVGADGNLTAKLAFTKACANCRRTIPIQKVDKSNPEDIDTDGEDHLLDAIRYMVMSRPVAPLTAEEKHQRTRLRRKMLRPVVSDLTGY